MVYQGSKAAIADKILPIILYGRKPGQVYVEPFAGGCNPLCKVSGPRIAADQKKKLIALWKGLQEGDSLRRLSYSRNLYDGCRIDVAAQVCYSDFEIGAVGFIASYAGKFFGGYNATNGRRNYIDERIRNIERQIPGLKGVDFRHTDYRKLRIPPKSIVYADPPYRGTTAYKTPFDYDAFIEWCYRISDEGHLLFVSEYAPPTGDFTEVWAGKGYTILNRVRDERTEKLFTLI